MDVKTRIMIDKITEYVRKEYKIIGPISDIESIVVSMGGIIVEKTAIDDLSDIWIRKSGKESFEIFLPPVQISWTIERRNFMIAHELGHLFLHMGFRINDDKWNNQMKGFYRNNDAETNYQANEFFDARRRVWRNIEPIYKRQSGKYKRSCQSFSCSYKYCSK